MKKQNFDFTFKLQNPSKTINKHQTKINTLNKEGVKFSDILNTTSYDLAEYIMSKKHYQLEILFKGTDNTKKSHVRTLKTIVNSMTRELIQRGFVYVDKLSKYYDTAFYVRHYNYINRLMTATTKVLLDWCQAYQSL